MGRHRQALAPATEAATIRRRLATADPGAHLPDLATSSPNLGLLLADLGQGADALTAATEAVTIRRRLAVADPTTYLPKLARSLSGYAHICLRTRRDPPGALDAVAQSVDLYTQLAERHPERFSGQLLTAYIILADTLEAVGRATEATLLRRWLTRPWAGADGTGPPP